MNGWLGHCSALDGRRGVRVRYRVSRAGRVGLIASTRYRPLTEEHSVDREDLLPVNAATG